MPDIQPERIMMNLQQVYLQPGELHIARGPAIITTILGSCVSVTLRHPGLKLAAMCHIMLPEASATEDDFRYAHCAVNHMVRNLAQLGARASALEVKMFGGADMFGPVAHDLPTLDVARRNVDSTLDSLKQFGLKPSAADVRGQQGRRIRFDTRSGEVLVQRMNKLPSRPRG